MNKISISLIVCTRNRPNRIRALLTSIAGQIDELNHVVIVDSSTDHATEQLVHDFGGQNLVYCRSKAGLPYQRNVGIDFICHGADVPTVIAFLDDDITVPVDYFKNVALEFGANPNALAICGFDTNLKPPRSSWGRRLFGLREDDDFGRVLNSGIAIPVYEIEKLTRVDWAPGHSLNVRADVFNKIKFDPSIRMYGEDVDFCLRLGQLGPIYISPLLGVSHNPEPSGRDGTSAAEAFNAGFRYSLATTHPGKVSKAMVLVSSVALCLGYFAQGLLRWKTVDLLRSRGLALFLLRVVTGKPVVQSHTL